MEFHASVFIFESGTDLGSDLKGWKLETTFGVRQFGTDFILVARTF
jgi:hypothetical protein